MPPVLFSSHNPSPLTGAGNNTWLIDGAEPALVDAGVGNAAHVDAIAAHLESAGRKLARVLVTHGHGDHASGVPALRAKWPALEACKWIDRGEDPAGWRPLRAGETIRAGGGVLTVIYTPGHARDHVCFFDETSKDLYSGDMILQGTTVMIPAGRGGSLRDYLASLESLAALGPARAFPGHGPIIDRPVALIEEYLEHRRLRERQVRACLEAGTTDVDAIVAHIYPDLAAAIRPAARLTVEAHLEKLREEELAQ
jgi:glyoxylase-like metal-dependent hydrolase (beta-lactamase superfamily II)